MSKKLSENLNSLMVEAKLNAEELSRRIGMPASTIKKIRNNHEANPTLSTLLSLANFFSLTITQLVGDEPFPTSRIKGSYKPNSETLHYVPLISWEEAVTWPTVYKQGASQISTEYSYSQHAYALLVEDEDWENLVKDTVLLIDPEFKVEHRDYIIVYKIGQKKPTVKQALFDEGQLYLKPIVQGYNIVAFTQEHTILGVIVECKKKFKKQYYHESE